MEPEKNQDWLDAEKKSPKIKRVNLERDTLAEHRSGVNKRNWCSILERHFIKSTR